MQEVKMFACTNCGHTLTIDARKAVARTCHVCLQGEMKPVSINFERRRFEMPEE